MYQFRGSVAHQAPSAADVSLFGRRRRAGRDFWPHSVEVGALGYVEQMGTRSVVESQSPVVPTDSRMEQITVQRGKCIWAVPLCIDRAVFLGWGFRRHAAPRWCSLRARVLVFVGWGPPRAS